MSIWLGLDGGEVRNDKTVNATDSQSPQIAKSEILDPRLAASTEYAYLSQVYT